MGCPLLGSRAGRVSNQGECPRGPFLRVPRPIFQSIRKYCKNNLHKGKAPVGRGREEPQDEPFLMSPCLTDLQGVDNPTDILFWNQRVVKLESTNVICRDVCGRQGL